MTEDAGKLSTIDEYIQTFPSEVQAKLNEMRQVIQAAAPAAREKIAWQMPTFVLHGNLVHFAAHKNHIGFYPGANGIAEFKERLAGYKSSKGAVQFPIANPLPLDLIDAIVKFRVAENMEQAKDGSKQKG